MSGGTPVGVGGYMRQRHSQGYGSSGDDLEDDACSRSRPSSPESLRPRTWLEVIETVLWIASAVFFFYFGDGHSNMIYLLRHDGRIRRIPFYLGMFAVGVNTIIFFYTSLLAWSMKKFEEKWDFSSTSTLPYVAFFGLVSFCSLSFAFWPIWGFLTLPLLFTLFMGCMVVFPKLMLGTLRPEYEDFRTD